MGVRADLSGKTQAKIHVYLILLCCCITASTVTYVAIRNQEEKEFESDFRRFAKDIQTSAISNTQARIDVANVLSIHASSYAHDGNLEFPFVTIPNFELRSRKAREMSQAELVMLIPLVARQNEVPPWENFARNHSSAWIQKGLENLGLENLDPGPIPQNIHSLLSELSVSTEAHGSENANAVQVDLKQYAAPCWQTGPAPTNASVVNADFLGYQLFGEAAAAVVLSREGSISRLDKLQVMQRLLADFFPREEDGMGPGDNANRNLPYSLILDPVFASARDLHNSKIVAFHAMVVGWDVFFQNILPEGTNGLEVVLSDSCGSVYTFGLRGPRGVVLGKGDLHDVGYKDYRQSAVIANVTAVGDDSEAESPRCQYVMDIYPSEEFELLYLSSEPYIFALMVAGLFSFVISVFLAYDFLVRRRQRKIDKTANRTLAIVSALFPKNVRERILDDVDEEMSRAESAASLKNPLMRRGNPLGNRARGQLSDFLKSWSTSDEDEEEEEDSFEDDYEYHNGGIKSKPIADLFPAATVVFADIVGFTAWSSTREPTQVFLLLEAVYQVFDRISMRHGVFKVETVGDCYVAVAGLPEPRQDHAVAIAKFAFDCIVEFNATVKALVLELGPDTEELKLRVGMHSGPVIAGVLRGHRARFQLFGDTMNTTARMESTGAPDRIQVSQETAELLAAEGRSSWISARIDKVDAKGKGKLQTYWLQDEASPAENDVSVHDGSVVLDADLSARLPPSHSQHGRQPVATSEKYNRLVAWNFDILSKLLQQVVERRECRRIRPDPVNEIRSVELHFGASRYILSEVQEIVRLPKYKETMKAADEKTDWLSDDVKEQLRDYVQTLAAMYRDNPFHNFEHASHVTMSVVKLLSRIVAPDASTTRTDTEEALHDHTYGITSDPMTQFAVALSALVHDVDHTGVPNSQLIKEKSALAVVYRNKSVAEQNSVDLAWDVLMDEGYSDLRRAIYSTKAEFMRFRQLVVNLVLATDIMDKDLAALRRGRWMKAFDSHHDPMSSATHTESHEDAVNRKATIVMEHLIQASDVAHTMQHWQIYRKWNQRFFCECYEAFLAGRADNDPSESWYEGEKSFFDYYIIPLARKLKDCGVFGVSSDEYLQYALQNRKEWERKGQEIVAVMLESYRQTGKSKDQIILPLTPSPSKAFPLAAPEQAPVHSGSS